MARDEEFGRGDAAGVGPYVRDGAPLTRLGELGWDIIEGSPDIRGWEVKTIGGREIGRVQDLLVDEAQQEVVMIEIDLKDSSRTAQAPIRRAQIERAAHVVRVDSADLLGVDAAERERVSDGVPAAGAPAAGAPAVGADRIAVRRREAAAGAVEGEETVVERRPVVVEEVVVRRRTVNADELDPEERARLAKGEAFRRADAELGDDRDEAR